MTSFLTRPGQRRTGLRLPPACSGLCPACHLRVPMFRGALSRGPTAGEDQPLPSRCILGRDMGGNRLLPPPPAPPTPPGAPDLTGHWPAALKCLAHSCPGAGPGWAVGRDLGNYPCATRHSCPSPKERWKCEEKLRAKRGVVLPLPAAPPGRRAPALTLHLSTCPHPPIAPHTRADLAGTQLVPKNQAKCSYK